MRRISSHSSLSSGGGGGGAGGPGATGSSPATTAAMRRLSRDSRNVSAQSLTDLAAATAAAAAETMIAPSVVSHTIECVAQYGFPDTTLQPRDLAECLATPEHQAEAAEATPTPAPTTAAARMDQWIEARMTRRLRRRAREK